MRIYGRKPQWEVVTCGDVFVDLVMSGFPRWPEPGEEVVAQSLAREIGGGAAITACGLAQLGCRVALRAAIGTDGEWFRERLGGQGVALDLLEIDERNPTAITVAVSTVEDRSFFTYPGANRGLAELLASEKTIEAMIGARHVHLASAVAPERLIELGRRLRAAGTTLSVDVGWVESWLRDPASLIALREVDLFMPNEREGEAMTGTSDPVEMLRRFAAAGVRRVALKLGAAGSMMIEDGVIEVAPGIEVAAIDTTGAGDCFDAGFLAAWVAGESPRKCLQQGNLCGAWSTTALGGVNGFPSGLRAKR
jgi:sugar/nucleoside kinase (ribokinase family)